MWIEALKMMTTISMKKKERERNKTVFFSRCVHKYQKYVLSIKITAISGNLMSKSFDTKHNDLILKDLSTIEFIARVPCVVIDFEWISFFHSLSFLCSFWKKPLSVINFSHRTHTHTHSHGVGNNVAKERKSFFATHFLIVVVVIVFDELPENEMCCIKLQSTFWCVNSIRKRCKKCQYGCTNSFFLPFALLVGALIHNRVTEKSG